MDVMKSLEAEQTKENAEVFRIGDTVKVHYKIIEGKTERVQVFEGIVIAMKRDGLRKTFTVRKISYGVGVERIFPLHSPKIAKIVRVREGRIRRSKLYYLRGRTGKAAKVQELIHRRREKVPETGTAERPEEAVAEAPEST
jgi:large subunit ribosomal protein L19